MKTLILFPILIMGLSAKAQQVVSNNHQNAFNLAYQQYPDIPKGVLEAVSFTQTRFKHLDLFIESSCIGIPNALTVMGLCQDGKGYFRNNLKQISRISNYSENDILNSPTTAVLAYAAAYNHYMDSLNVGSDINDHALIMSYLSELPIDHNPVNNFALNSHIYSVFSFLKNPTYQLAYNFPSHPINLNQIFGTENAAILGSSKIILNDSAVYNAQGASYQPIDRSAEYGPAIWTPAPSCNYSSRSGTAISAITIHTIQGSYAGAISWSQNCASNVSYHYVIRSSDGQVTQMVLEANKAWHVGSANPYTIGYEHEGYVNDPAWYTQAMVSSSADLSRDVTQSGYGINPLRTYFGPATTGTNTLGSCTQIKGHQHYPSQSHTDPGINWDWEEYYQLINNSPPVTNFTAGSGSLFDSGGATGNYSDDERETYLIAPTGATSVTIDFISFDLENNWDYLFVYDGSAVGDPLLGTYTGSNLPSSLTSTGGSILIEFRSDCATNNAGWEISWTSNAAPGAGDYVDPITLVSAPSAWQTTDFNTSFTDTDNVGGSGIKHKFYQVIDYDGNEWRANADEGFFSDNFDNTIHPEWITVVGNWSISNAHLLQSDETEGNTNIYAGLDQNNDSKFLYHWAGMIDGAGSNKRAGFHFMCSDGALTNRGDSYFVWLRSDNDKVQIYKVINDVFSLEQDVPFTVNDGQWYDTKVVFDKTAGKIDVWLDDSLAASWTDPSPYLSGDYISYRSGDASYEVNNLKIYHDRSNSELVSVGPTDQIRFQNPNPLTPSGRVKSITIDTANNISAIDFNDINVDWTPPEDILVIQDGTGAVDIDTTYNNTELTAIWATTVDTNSSIARYWYAIGTSPGGTNVVNWTDNWYSDTGIASGLSLVYGTTYYFSVRAENGAGLLSNIITSDGQYLDLPSQPPVANFNIMNTFICVTDSIQIINFSSNASTYNWTIPGANISNPNDPSPFVTFPSSGTYTVTLDATGPGGSDTDVQTFNITVEQLPIASFTASDTVLTLPNGFVGFNNASQNANGYYWEFDDGFFSTSNTPWHSYYQAGTYEVMMIAVNGSCPNDTAYQTIVVNTFNGTGNQDETDFYLYPNPVQNELNLMLNLTNNALVRVNLMDVQGKLIQRLKQESIAKGLQRLSIDLSDVAEGNYIIQVNIDGKISQQQIVKQ